MNGDVVWCESSPNFKFELLIQLFDIFPYGNNPSTPILYCYIDNGTVLLT